MVEHIIENMAADLVVTTIQADIISDAPQANLDQLSGIFETLKEHPDLIVLPEVFTTGFGKNARKHADSNGGKVYQWLADQSRKNNAAICGSVIVKDGDYYYNRLIWMQPDGKYFEYNKRHLFRMLNEHERYEAGKKQLQVQLKGWTISPFICYDLRFPVWMRNTSNYDLSIVVANWPAQRSEHWKSLLKARAIENLSYCLGCNRIGSDLHGNNYSGDSLLYDANGTEIMHMTSTDSVKTVLLNAKQLHDYRDSFPAHLDSDQFTLKTAE